MHSLHPLHPLHLMHPLHPDRVCHQHRVITEAHNCITPTSPSFDKMRGVFLLLFGLRNSAAHRFEDEESNVGYEEGAFFLASEVGASDGLG